MRTAASATTNARKISAKCGNGGAAAGWFSGMRENARPARRAGPIVRLPQFRSSWADEGGPIDGLWIGQADSYVA